MPRWTRPRWTQGGLLAAALALAAPAQAGDLVQLSDLELDGVTAGAITSVRALSRAANSCCSATVQTSTQGDYFQGGSVDDGQGNTASAAQQGKVLTIGGDPSGSDPISVTIGVVKGETSTTGDAEATNTAQGVASGDFAFTAGGLRNVGGTNKQFGVIVAVAIDSPLKRAPASP